MRALLPIMLLATLVACKSTGKLKQNGQAGVPIQKIGIVVDGFQNPKSVLLTNYNMFVSNLGYENNPKQADGDGYISKLSLGGELQHEKFITGLDAPKGMVEVNDILYVSDITGVKKFTCESGEARGLIDFQAYRATNLVDITAMSNDILLISDADLNLVFTLNVNTEEVSVLNTPDGLMGVYGMYYDQQSQLTLMAGVGEPNMKNGKLSYMYPSDMLNTLEGHVEVLSSPLGTYEGICLYAKKYISFSDPG